MIFWYKIYTTKKLCISVGITEGKNPVEITYGILWVMCLLPRFFFFFVTNVFHWKSNYIRNSISISVSNQITDGIPSVIFVGDPAFFCSGCKMKLLCIMQALTYNMTIVYVCMLIIITTIMGMSWPHQVSMHRRCYIITIIIGLEETTVRNHIVYVRSFYSTRIYDGLGPLCMAINNYHK